MLNLLDLGPLDRVVDGARNVHYGASWPPKSSRQDQISDELTSLVSLFAGDALARMVVSPASLLVSGYARQSWNYEMNRIQAST